MIISNKVVITFKIPEEYEVMELFRETNDMSMWLEQATNPHFISFIHVVTGSSTVIFPDDQEELC